MRCDRGYTVIEALIVVVLLIVVLGGTLSMLEHTARVAPAENERAHAVREAQVGLATIVRELRQARSVEQNTPTGLTVRTPVAGVPTMVTYDCGVRRTSRPGQGLHACRRIQYQADDSTVARTTHPLDRLVHDEIFEYTLSSGKVEFVRVRVAVPASGERSTGLAHPIVLDDGFFLRNLSDG